MTETKASFTGSIPEFYDRYLGSAWFDAYAKDIAARLPAKPPGDVLEVACGTGIVTQRLRQRLDPSVRLVASDLSPAMLGFARAKLAGTPGIDFRQADVQQLPFADAEFGAVVCNFGMMFFPDRAKALAEMRRVLREGGLLRFNVWDRIEANPHALALAELSDALFPDDPEMRQRFAFDMCDFDGLRALLSQAGFEAERIELKRVAFELPQARDLATGLARGTPRSLMYVERGMALEDVVAKLEAKLAASGGAAPYRGNAQAVVVEARAAKSATRSASRG
ncbi:MAG: class I SAM-dependent methyltransferase [Bacillota bacterium]